MEEENKNVGSEETTKNTGTEQVTEQKKKTLDELLAEDKELQSQYDKKITNSLKTARTTWEEENRTKQAEAERLAKMDEYQKKDYELQQIQERANKAEIALNAYKLKDETIRQASSKGIPLELIQTLDFEKETAESITQKLDIFEKTYKSEREKAISEYSKEPSPKTGDRVSQKSLSELKTYEEIAKYYEEHPNAN